MGPTEPTPLDWRGLTAAEPEAVAAASSEVEMYVRALAAYGVIIDRDAVPSELEDRQITLRTKLWPPQPLAGYGLHSSLGAYLVTKVAVDLVPTGHLGLRPEHLSPAGLRQALIDQGLSEAAAGSVVGDWPGKPEGFHGDPSGLSLSVLAGLAARTLTREERTEALAQVAASPRDLARLAATTSLLLAVRKVLPLLPIPSIGSGYDIGLVGLSVGRGDRVATLLQRPHDVLEAALYEMGAAMAALGAGEPYTADVDVQVVMPTALAADLLNGEGTADDLGDGFHADAGPLAAVCRWRGSEVEAQDLATWQEGASRWRSTTGTLGLRLPAPPPTAVPLPLPPEAALIRRSIYPHGDASDRIDLEPPPFKWRQDSLDAVVPVVRGAIRLIAAAAEGQAPPPGTLERSGDLAWLIRRASALAAVARGELKSALALTQSLAPGVAPERRWAQDRLRRFTGKTPRPAAPEEARPVAATLIGDLGHQLARTITGTVPRERR